MSAQRTSGVVYLATGSRQKRFERREDPPPVDVAADHRCFQLFHWLLKLRFLTTDQIARLLYRPGSRKYAERRLRALYDNQYLDRFPWPVERRWGRTRAQFGAVRAIHCLDKQGAGFLADHYGVARSEVDWQPRDNRKPGALEHTLALNDFQITAHLAAQREGWQFEIVQTEREVDKQDGHDRVRDPVTSRLVTVRPDGVCRLIFGPSRQGIYFSPELDMGTEGPKKIRAKARAHVAHFTSGAYERRHGVTSSRVLFVVADVRDPLLERPLDEDEWRARVVARCEDLKHWTEDEIAGARKDLFWYVPAFALTEETIYRAPVWSRAGESGQHPLVG
jgi:hypothetical protein